MKTLIWTQLHRLLTTTALLSLSQFCMPPPAHAQEISKFITGEYLWNGGLYQIKAHAAYDLGITGEGVTVAVLDTGVNYLHPELFTQIADGGFNFYDNNFDYMDYNGHGTLVTGIIAAKKDDYGIHGVAYNSKVLPIKVRGNEGEFLSLEALNYGLYHAIQNGVTAVNYSSTYATGNGFELNDFAFQASTAFGYTALGGTIIVGAAGNTAAPNPIFPALLPYVKPENHNKGVYSFATEATFDPGSADFSYSKGLVLAVASTDSNGVISDFSNRCGVAAAWCLAAPGENIISTFWYDTYIDMKGTSLSAPYVTGAIALLKEMFPGLSNAQLVEILLSSANKSGIYADESIYGQGFLDIEKAVQPQGNLMLVSSDGSASTARFQDSSIQSSSAFGNSVSKSLSGQTTLAQDRFNRTYKIPLETTAQTTDPSQDLSLEDKIGFMQRESQRHSIQLSNNLTLTSFLSEGENAALNERNIQYSLWSYNTGPYTLSFQNGYSSRWDEAETSIPATQRLRNRLFEPSALDMAVKGPSFKWDYTTTPQTTLSVNWREGENLHQEDLKANALTARWQWKDSTQNKRIDFMSGQITEEESTLGLTSHGAFALAPHSQTLFAGVNAAWPLARNTSLLGSFYAGQTTAKGASGSLINAVSTIKHQETTLGIEQRNILNNKDSLSLVLQQPLRVTSGSFTLGAFNANDPDTGSVRVGLSPKHQEQALHLFYDAPMQTLDGHYALQLAVRDNAGHVQGEKSAELLFHAKVTF